MPKMIITGDDPIMRPFLCRIEIDGAEYKIPYNGGQPTCIDVPEGLHDVLITTEIADARNLYESCSITLLGNDAALFYIEQGEKPVLHVKNTTADRVGYELESIRSASEVKQDTDEKSGVPWLLTALIPVAGIGAGIYNLCRKNKRTVTGALCIALNLALILVLLVAGIPLLSGDGGSSTDDISRHPLSSAESGNEDVSEPEETSEDISLPEESTEERFDPVDMYINASGKLNLRESPSEDSPTVLKMDGRTLVTVHNIKDGWAYVEYKGKFGWCSAEYLTETLPGDTPPNADDYTLMYVYAGGNLNLRETPDTDGARVAKMPDHSEVKVFFIRDNWAFAEYEGKMGWCSADYLLTELPMHNTGDLYITEAQYESALKEADRVFKSYYGKTAKYSKKKLTPSEVLDYFDEVQLFTSWQHYSFCDMMGDTVGTLYINTEDIGFCHVIDKYDSLEQVCDRYFSYYTDDTAFKLLSGRIIGINNELFAMDGAFGDAGVETKHEFEVKTVSDERYEITVVTTAYWEDGTEIFTDVYPLVLENGAWVFEIPPFLFS